MTLKEDFRNALIWAGMKGVGTYQFIPEQLEEGLNAGFDLVEKRLPEKLPDSFCINKLVGILSRDKWYRIGYNDAIEQFKKELE